MSHGSITRNQDFSLFSDTQSFPGEKLKTNHSLLIQPPFTQIEKQWGSWKPACTGRVHLCGSVIACVACVLCARNAREWVTLVIVTRSVRDTSHVRSQEPGRGTWTRPVCVLLSWPHVTMGGPSHGLTCVDQSMVSWSHMPPCVDCPTLHRTLTTTSQHHGLGRHLSLGQPCPCHTWRNNGAGARRKFVVALLMSTANFYHCFTYLNFLQLKQT